MMHFQFDTMIGNCLQIVSALKPKILESISNEPIWSNVPAIFGDVQACEYIIERINDIWSTK